MPALSQSASTFFCFFCLFPSTFFILSLSYRVTWVIHQTLVTMKVHLLTFGADETSFGHPWTACQQKSSALGNARWNQPAAPLAFCKTSALQSQQSRQRRQRPRGACLVGTKVRSQTPEGFGANLLESLTKLQKLTAPFFVWQNPSSCANRSALTPRPNCANFTRVPPRTLKPSSLSPISSITLSLWGAPASQH